MACPELGRPPAVTSFASTFPIPDVETEKPRLTTTSATGLARTSRHWASLT